MTSSLLLGYFFVWVAEQFELDGKKIMIIYGFSCVIVVLTMFNIGLDILKNLDNNE